MSIKEKFIKHYKIEDIESSRIDKALEVLRIEREDDFLDTIVVRDEERDVVIVFRSIHGQELFFNFSNMNYTQYDENFEITPF